MNATDNDMNPASAENTGDIAGTPAQPRIIMVTGGQRSGKSAFAESLALGLSARPTYLATARIFDDDMRRRVEIHRQRRTDRWDNVESPLDIASLDPAGRDVVLIDCLTLLATNWFFESGEDPAAALEALRDQISRLAATGLTLIFVTNEIGLGGISPNRMQRQFADLQGSINQYVAAMADQVYMTISGIPVKIKS